MKKLLVLSLMAMVLCGCGSNNTEPQTATKESAKDANGDYAKVTLEVTDGKITKIDLDETSQGTSKKELGEEYILNNGLDKVELDGNGYAKNDDVLAGCTINIANMMQTAKDAEASLK